MLNRKIFWSGVLFTIFSFAGVAAQQPQTVRKNRLSTENSSWQTVISGKALCAPKKTSYGFAILTDGKMICACTESGVKLWEKGIPGHPEPFLTVFSSDFLLSVSDNSHLTLINPSGLTLWTENVSFKINQDPQIGRDSRIFVKGKNNIACYGVNGVCKWKLKTDSQQDKPLYELNDGTLLVLLETLKDGKTTAIRVSPFGEIIETINFTGIIQSACSCPDGVLLTFNGGGAGMCAVTNNITGTKWSIPYTDRAFSNTNPSKGSEFRVLSNHRSALFTGGSGQVKTRILIFSTLDGRVSDWFNADADMAETVCIAVTSENDNLFLCDSSKAIIHNTSGDVIWYGTLPESPDLFSKWNFITFTKGNYLVICSKSWAMAGFRTSYRITKKNSYKDKKTDYSSFFTEDPYFSSISSFADKIDERYSDSGRRESLQKGNYGSKEIDYISRLMTLTKVYNTYLIQNNSGARPEHKSVFEQDSTGVQQMLTQLSLVGTDQFVSLLASFIKIEDDDSRLQLLLQSIANFGYDPNGAVLSAIDIRSQKLQANRTTEFILICDAVYEICRFMGRPALYAHGMDILTKLMYPQYDSSVRDYARKTLTKIAGMKI